MKKVLFAILILVMVCGTCYAGGGRGGGGHGGGGRGGGGWHGGGRGYYRGGCGYWGGGYSSAFWGCAAGSAVGSLLAGIITAPQEVVVREVVPVAQPVYVQPVRPYYIVTCPKCGNQLDCSGIPAGARASCPYCGNIL